MGNNLYDSGSENFKTTKTLNKLPKIIIITVFTVMAFLIMYMIMSAGNDTPLSDKQGLEIVSDANNNNNMDEFVKNMADKAKRGNDSQTSPITEDDLTDFRDKMPEKVTEQPLPPVVSDESIKPQVSIPISSLTDDKIKVLKRDNEMLSTRLTSTEIMTFRQKRLTTIDQALNAKTLVLSNLSNDAKPDTLNVGALTSKEPASYQEQIKEIMAMTAGKQAQSAPTTPNNTNANKWYLDSRLEPSSIERIKTGSVIPATLITGINSTVDGQVTAQVRQNVYDTATGKNLLIPQGTRIIGQYASEVPYGHKRIFIAWNRLVFSNGTSLDIGSMPGADMSGKGGFQDKVNNHYLRLFGNSLLLSAIMTGISLTQQGGLLNNYLPFYAENAADTLSQSLGQNFGETMSQMIRKNMNIAPELTIRSGYLFNIMVVQDITLPKYIE